MGKFQHNEESWLIDLRRESKKHLIRRASIWNAPRMKSMKGLSNIKSILSKEFDHGTESCLCWPRRPQMHDPKS
jgi:hypothetical protein